MKWKKYGVQVIVGLMIVAMLALGRGLGEKESAADAVLVICDSFTIVSFMYLGIGSLLWVSTTGFFDIFGFAFRTAAHMLVPGMVKEGERNFYDYKMAKVAERPQKPLRSTFIVGLIFLVISILLTLVWHQVSA